MFCEKCGEKIKEGNSFCTNCGTPKKLINKVEQTEVVQNNVVVDEDNKKANLLCIISLLCYFVGPIIFFLVSVVLALLSKTLGTIFNVLVGAPRIAGIVLMIVARIKYPKNTFAKVLMWIYIGFACVAVLIALFFIILMIIGLLSYSTIY